GVLLFGMNGDHIDAARHQGGTNGAQAEAVEGGWGPRILVLILILALSVGKQADRHREQEGKRKRQSLHGALIIWNWGIMNTSALGVGFLVNPATVRSLLAR